MNRDSRSHHANRYNDDGEEEKREDNRASDFVLLWFVVVVMVVSHGTKIHGKIVSRSSSHPTSAFDEGAPLSITYLSIRRI